MRDIRDFDYFLIYADYIQPITKGWKIVIFTIILGLITSSLYIFTLPSKFEVVAKIKMPRFSLGAPLDKLDEPSKIPIRRINLQSNFQQIDYLCNSQSDNKNLDLILEMFFAEKNKNFLVEVSFYQDSEDLVKNCLSRLLDSINKSYLIKFNDLKIKFISKKLELNENIKKRINEDKIYYAEIDTTKDYHAVKYNLVDRIRSLEDLVLSNISATEEIYYEAAQYLNDSIIIKSRNGASRKFLILLIGLIGSFLISALYILIRQKIVFNINNLQQNKNIDTK